MSIFNKASNASYWRGFDYFENGHVLDLKKISEDIYTAIVKGSKKYDVKVDLSHPLKSSCTCPFTEGNHKICKHMIAVAFSVCPDEVKKANKIREEYYYEQEHKEELLEEIMKQKRAEIRKYVNGLTAKEVKEMLYNKLVNDEYDIAYKKIYEDDEW